MRNILKDNLISPTHRTIQNTCTKIMKDILKNKGFSLPVDSQPKPPIDIDLPQDFATKFRGIYGLQNETIKISFNEKNNQILLAYIDKGEYINYSEGSYKSDGYFHMEDSAIYQLTSYSGVNYLTQVVKDDTNKIMVLGEMLEPISSGLTQSNFDGKLWFQNSIKPDDISSGLFAIIESGAIKSILNERLPGYIHINKVAYKLHDTSRADNTLGYIRDTQGSIILQNNILQWGNFTFNAKLDTMFEQIKSTTTTINAAGNNRWFKVSNNGNLKSVLSKKKRIIVYDKDYEFRYDSLTDSTPSKDLSLQKGDYICLVGEPTETFELKFTPVDLTESL